MVEEPLQVVEAALHSNRWHHTPGTWKQAQEEHPIHPCYPQGQEEHPCPIDLRNLLQSCRSHQDIRHTRSLVHLMGAEGEHPVVAATGPHLQEGLRILRIAARNLHGRHHHDRRQPKVELSLRPEIDSRRDARLRLEPMEQLLR